MKKYLRILLLLILLNPLSVFALSKTETVYSVLDQDGKVVSTKINTQISNLGKGEVVDYTKLEEIKNINGDEKFSRDSDKLIWKANGKDIFYQGKINKELPISVSVKYYLNGNEVKAKDLNNKKGNIKIEYTFINNCYDSNSSMYTPFVVSLISPLSGKDYSNMSVKNGKIVKTGNKNIIVGVAAPGLGEDLPIDVLSSMDRIVVSYDTDKYQANEVYFGITPKLLDKADLSKLSLLDTAHDAVNQLQDGMNKLESGSLELSNGVVLVDDGLGSLNYGIKEALKGSSQISEGLSQIAQGSSKLSGMNALVDELYNTYLNNEALLNNITSGLTAQQLQGGIAQATIAKTNLENQLSQVNAGISQLEQLEAAGMISEEQMIQLQTLRGQRTQLEAGIEQYAQGIAEATANLQALPQAVAKLSGADETIIKILMGILGVSSPQDVNETSINLFKGQMNSLINGINTLDQGSKKLTNGLNDLANGSDTLKNGTSSLRSGSLELSNGITRINNEGIKRLSSYAEQLGNYSSKVKQLVDLSKSYKGFGSSNTDNTIFIYKIKR